MNKFWILFAVSLIGIINMATGIRDPNNDIFYTLIPLVSIFAIIFLVLAIKKSDLIFEIKWALSGRKKFEEEQKRELEQKIEKENHAKKEKIELANKGNSQAQYEVARDGLVSSEGERFSYYKKAADSGYRDAYFEVGRRYEEGIGVSKDVEKAIEWYKKDHLDRSASRLRRLDIRGDGCPHLGDPTSFLGVDGYKCPKQSFPVKLDYARSICLTSGHTNCPYYTGSMYRCPHCDNEFSSTDAGTKFCWKCGYKP